MNIQEIGVIIGICVTAVTSVVAILLFFRRPQEDLEKKQAVVEKETEGKAAVLAQQLQWEKDSNDRRFTELSACMNNANALAQNHIHTVDVKVDNLISTVDGMGNRLTELATIINERIPRK
jgi:mannitol-specific phosphotransferase system IIBC component